MHIIPHNLLSDEHMWAHPCCTHIPPGQEQVPLDEAHEGCRDEFVRGLGRRLPANYGCWIVVFIWCNFYLFCTELLLYTKDVIHLCTMSHHTCETWSYHTWWLYYFASGFWTPKTRVWHGAWVGDAVDCLPESRFHLGATPCRGQVSADHFPSR
jgi:hypothetical protein